MAKNIQQEIKSLAMLRIYQITGDKKRGIEPLLPIGRSTFLKRVHDGVYPAGIKLSAKTTVWRAADIMDLLESFGGSK